ncbi:MULTISPECIES: hypothetical protein [unclassified Streptomyces]|uniref:hypothetical protein n=1 Tax=unclassified Streptomyces TaxID=2593676 RepID=UPI0033A8F470
MRESGEHTEGGDPVCWLNRVCDECGAFREDMTARACARCGTPFPTGDGVGPGQAREHPDRTDHDSPSD